MLFFGMFAGRTNASGGPRVWDPCSKSSDIFWISRIVERTMKQNMISPILSYFSHRSEKQEQQHHQWQHQQQQLQHLVKTMTGEYHDFTKARPGYQMLDISNEFFKGICHSSVSFDSTFVFISYLTVVWKPNKNL